MVGKPCGKGWIEAKDECHLLTKAVLSSIEANKIAAESDERSYKISAAKQAELESDEATRKLILREAAKQLSDSFTPSEALEVLSNKLDASSLTDDKFASLVSKYGNSPTLEQYASWVSEQDWYKNRSYGNKAKGKDDSTRKLPNTPDLYSVPSQKTARIDFKAAEELFNSLPSNIRAIFNTNNGEPRRGERAKQDWSSSKAMRIGQLQALMEQLSIDADGNPYVRDLLSPGGKLGTSYNLDHIVPLSKGGTHGELYAPGEPAQDGTSNWQWTSSKANTVKGDNDIVQYVDNLKKIVKGGDAAYERLLDKGVKRILLAKHEQDVYDMHSSLAQSGNLAASLSLYRSQHGNKTSNLRRQVLQALYDNGALPSDFSPRVFRDSYPAAMQQLAGDAIIEEAISGKRATIDSILARSNNKVDYDNFRLSADSISPRVMALIASKAKSGGSFIENLGVYDWTSKIRPLVTKSIPADKLPKFFPKTAEDYEEQTVANMRQLESWLKAKGFIQLPDALSKDGLNRYNKYLASKSKSVNNI